MLGLALASVMLCSAADAADVGPVPPENLSDFHTVTTARRTQPAAAGRNRRLVLLGLNCIAQDKTGLPVVADVLANSPAALVRVESGDVLLEFNGRSLT